ncbi:MAG: mechanosensitive ion channel family protein [Euryarchaeota archaeon]|nr:mechanosensitive ion channel family protein [Euryarchaeota archaeon]
MYEDLIIAVSILILTPIAARLLQRAVDSYFLELAKKTSTDLDEKILRAIKGPLYWVVILLGVDLAFGNIDALAGFREELQVLATILFVTILACTAVRVGYILIEWYSSKIGVDHRFRPMAQKVVALFIYAVAFIAILDKLEIEVTPLIASLGVATLAVGLALQDTLTNVFAGFYIVTDKPVRIGDYIRLENGDSGYVEDISWRSCRIRTLPNNVVVIPNSRLAQSVITNYYLPEPLMAVVIPCGVSYDSDLAKVEKVTVEAAKRILQEVPGGVKEFEPFIRYNRFGESNIEFSIILQVEKFVDQYLVIHEFIKELTARYRDAGIEISYPVRISIPRREGVEDG